MVHKRRCFSIEVTPFHIERNMTRHHLEPTYKTTLIPLVLLCLLFALPVHATVDEPLIQNGGYLVVAKSGKTLASYHPEINYTPASIFKIISALQALERLGETYRFPTYFFITPGIDLYIVGTGDPLLISEDIDGIVTALKTRGIKRVRNIFIDNSKYALERKTITPHISNNPYDTPLSAVGVNFNTIQIEITEDETIISGEPQTPTLPIMTKKGQGLPIGIHRINLGADSEDIVSYAGQLFTSGFNRAGIEVSGHINQRKTPGNAGLFYTHYSRPLKELLALVLLYSNNYMANQIYLKNGVKQYGYPATWQKAAKSMQMFLKDKQLIPSHVSIHDGAGLSRENKINCTAMIQVLQEFRKYNDLLPLKHNIPLKSGTMEGVYSYAGFLGQEKDAPAFVLILNQEKNNRDALLNQLLQTYAKSSASK